MEYDIDKIWLNAVVVPDYDANSVRKDCCGAWIVKSEYGNRNSKFGWEVDHIYPQSKGGGDEMDNLRPMQWENNLAKGDDFPIYTAVVCAKEADNEHIETQFSINEVLVRSLKERYGK